MTAKTKKSRSQKVVLENALPVHNQTYQEKVNDVRKALMNLYMTTTLKDQSAAIESLREKTAHLAKWYQKGVASTDSIQALAKPFGERKKLNSSEVSTDKWAGKRLRKGK